MLVRNFHFCHLLSFCEAKTGERERERVGSRSRVWHGFTADAPARSAGLDAEDTRTLEKEEGKESRREGTVGPSPQSRSQGVWHHLQESWGKAATPRPCPCTMTVTMTLDCACGERPVAPALPSPGMRRGGDVPTLRLQIRFPL